MARRPSTTQFPLFGDLTAPLVEKWQDNPDGWIGNATGIAFANIACAWSRGITEVAPPGPGLPPFWRAFYDHYRFDEACAAELDGRHPPHPNWFGAWYPHNDEELATWNMLSGYVAATFFPVLDEFANERLKPEVPVLHYRAGDVPFARHDHYCLPYYSFYDWCIECIPDRQWIIMTLLDAGSATRAQAAACRRYLDDLRCHLARRGIETRMLDGRSPYEDLYSMVHAPVLITSMFSSFSYFPGLAKPPGRYLTARSPQTGAHPEWMHKLAPLSHEQVDDYLDVETVVAMLRAGG